MAGREQSKSSNGKRRPDTRSGYNGSRHIGLEISLLKNALESSRSRVDPERPSSG